MENNAIRGIFQKEIEFKFKLEDLFALQFDYGEGYDEGYIGRVHGGRLQ